MGTDVAEAHGQVPNPSSFKVHRLMCMELMKLVDRVLTIFPEIEAARPRCPSGIQALVSLNLAVDKATKLLQYCRESSKLYLAATGDTIVKRFQRSSESLEKSLCEIKDMVPVSLEWEIHQIANDLRKSTYLLDLSEEEAGKALQQLLRKIDSTSASVEDTFRTAAVKLNITSQKEILIEKRSIKKLLGNVDAKDHKRKNILMYLYNLLKKYGDSVVVENPERVDEMVINSVPVENSFNGALNCPSMEDKPHKACRENVSEAITLSRAAPPEEYRCPLSSRIMYDPVIIASGQTYERFSIQKWFDEGHDSCPKTGMKLSNQSMTPNLSLKDLISRWCSNYGVAISDPSIEPETKSWEYSSNSIASFGSSMNDFRLHMDFSNISLGSMDASCYSYSLPPKPAIGLSLMSLQTKNDCSTPQSDANVHEMDLEFPSNLNELEWELQCKVIEDLKNSMKENDRVCTGLSGNVVEVLTRFLSDAHARQDIRAEKDGSDLFLTFLSKNRQGVLNIREETLSFLAGLLRSEVTEEVLSSLEVLSCQQQCISKFVAPGVLDSILEIIDSPIRNLKEKAVKILSTLSSSYVVCSQIVSLRCIPKLLPLLNDDDLSGNCILLLKKLCDFEEARISVVETKGCLASVAQLLESGSLEKQEHAVMILLSLCSQRVEYCELVMANGIIPSLVTISVNGSKKGQVGALELLRLLREACEDRASRKPEHDSSRNGSNRHDVDEKKTPSKLKPEHDSSRNGSNCHDVDEKKTPAKLFRFFRKK